MPPAAIRRPLTITLWLVLSSSCLALAPLILAAAWMMSALTGSPRARILARLAIAYFARDLAALVACGVLWVASGAGWRLRSPRMQRRHWRLLRWMVHGMAARALEELDVAIDAEPSPEAEAALRAEGPLIVFSRHAGPGDTLLIIDALLWRFDREPSVVFKEALALEPCVDLIAHRLPHGVLDTADREACEARIEQLSAGLTARGVLLLFPEGANFTAERRRSALASLRRSGRRRAAARGERLAHVMPPRPTGALAALAGNPRAGVVFAAHTGLGLATYPRQWWREMPVGRTLHTRMWFVPAAERPAGHDEQVSWLFDWWDRIDAWIDAHHEEPRHGVRAAAPASIS